MADDPTALLREQLARLLQAEIVDLLRLSGGASRETWSFDSLDSSGRRALILRRDPPSAARVGGMPLEARMFDAAAKAGVAVPTIRVSGDADPELLATGFLVMDRVDGETIARKILRDDRYEKARSVLPAQMGEALARLHAVDPASVEGLEPSDPLAKYRLMLDDLGYPSPAFELGFRWLVANRPAARPTCIVHGDFRLGNVIVDESGLAAVLDWELAHLGDPMEDLAWLCVRAWRFGGAGPVAGLGSYEQLFRAYESAGGTEVDPVVVRWWETLGTLMWGVMCALQASAHINGAIRSVELAAIGRRVVEQEHDLLDLLGVPRCDVPTMPTTPARLPIGAPPLRLPGAGEPLAVAALPSDTFGVLGAPTAAGLVEALREFLERDVMTSTTGRVQFHARVAINVVAMLERELALAPHIIRVHTEGLASLGVADEAELARAIRTGMLDDRSDAVRSFVRETVTARLAVANPKHLAAPG